MNRGIDSGTVAAATPTLLLATRSQNKLREIRAILGAPFDGRLVTLADIGLAPAPAEDAIERFETFRENAIAKAAYFSRLTGMATIADDSGLRVDALGGAPGARSKRFSGRTDLAGTALDQANNDALLERMFGVPGERRGASYLCAAVLSAPDRAPHLAIGTVNGRILEQPEGEGGFGYDPLFFVRSEGRSFGRIAPTRKNHISHRARAFRALAATCTLPAGPAG